MTSSTRLALLLGLQLAAGASFVGCGSDPAAGGDDTNTGTGKADGGVTGKQDSTGTNTLDLTYAPMYSAFVEGHEAQIPVLLKDTSLRGKGATFTSSDPTIAVVSDTADGATVTVKKEGTVNIKASLNGETGVSKLTIKKYTEDQWKTGQARYSKSELAVVDPNGKAPTAITIATPGARNANGACNTCHTQQAKLLKIENGPMQIAGYSDDELITIFTMGKKPEGAAMKTQIPAFFWGQFHSWTVTEDEKPGLIAFLRTQAPKANGTIDYGVGPCPGAAPSTSPIPTNLCDRDGNPIMIPGMGGATGSTTDAGAGATKPATDAGTTSSAADAGVAAAGDAG